MAKVSTIVKNDKRLKLSKKYSVKRNELRSILKDPNADDEAKLEAQFALQRLPRNSAEVRHRNRCVVSGRSRGYYRKFGLSRIAFRELSLRGLVPGVRKSSW
jgi:small subunit ribosomal protein S14